uniref:uncharacterized protein LOC120329989 n=1 Tax=Styela clava TaxID=7725 RepID=UPI00193AA1F6|nr:uncharacterized protein LOC120329989 [Styela clava]
MKIQNSCLRICCGSMSSSSIKSLQAASEEMPLHIRHLLKCLTYRCHLLSYSIIDHPAHSIIKDSWQEIYPDSVRFKSFNMLTKSSIFQQFKIKPRITSSLPYWNYDCPHVDLTLAETLNKDVSPDVVRLTLTEHLEHYYPNYLIIFTDRSKNENGCGSAFFVPSRSVERSYPLPQLSSSYNAELNAILQSLKWVNAQCNAYETVILSDCQSALQSIEACTDSSNEFVVDIKSSYFQTIAMGKRVTFLWIPGHKDIPGNERVDLLAKRATISPTSAACMNIEENEAKSLLSDVCHRKWDTEYIQSEDTNHFKMFHPELPII